MKIIKKGFKNKTDSSRQNHYKNLSEEKSMWDKNMEEVNIRKGPKKINKS